MQNTIKQMTNQIIKVKENIKSLSYIYQKKKKNEVQKFEVALSYKLDKKQASKEKKLQDKLHKLEMNLKRLYQNKEIKVYKVKDKSDQKLRQELLTLKQKKVRLRDCINNKYQKGYCKCISCDNIRHYKAMQGGHCFTRSCLGIAIDERNINAQCPTCNAPTSRGGKNGNPVGYREGMIEKYGEKVYNKLLWIYKDRQRNPGNYKRPCRNEILRLIEETKLQIKQYEILIDN